MIIGICGAGTMGRGIAISSLTAGHSVVMVDLSDSALDAAQTSVREQLRKAVEKGKMTEEQCDRVSASVSTSTDLGALHAADMVIEAIAERIDIKHTLFSSLEKVVTPEAVLATNTSSISIAALARVLENPSRFVGLHFFNPAHIMKLVEIIKGPRTSSETVETCISFAKGLGKTPVVAADAPGFIVNRIARNYYNESQRIVMEGASTIHQVDSLMRGLGFKMGPFELMDLIGVDVNLDVTKSQWEQFFNEPRFTPSLLQQQYVDAGLHGKKSGKGFTI